MTMTLHCSKSSNFKHFWVVRMDRVQYQGSMNNAIKPYIDALPTLVRALVPTDEIEQAFKAGLDSITPSSSPQFYAIGGGVAAGKSTLFQKLHGEGKLPANAHLHDPDEVMVGLASYQKMLGIQGPDAAQKVFDKSALAISEAILQYALDQKKNVIYMRTLASADIFEQLDSIKAKGYQLTVLHGVFTDPDLIKERITKRTMEEGRTFPFHIAMERTAQFTENFPKCSTYFEQVYTWENNDQLVLTADLDTSTHLRQIK